MGLGKLFFLLFFLVTSRNNRLEPQTWAQTDISQRDKIHLSFNKKKKKKKKAGVFDVSDENSASENF